MSEAELLAVVEVPYRDELVKTGFEFKPSNPKVLNTLKTKPIATHLKGWTCDVGFRNRKI